MTEIILLLYFFFFSVFTCSNVFSTPMNNMPKTSFLDVSAAIQNSIHFLSFNPETVQHEQESTPSSTVRLYSRDTLQTSQFTSYKDLTLSRLERDALRVKYISKKVNLALGPDTMTDIEAPLSPGIGEYYARVGFGTPSHSLNTIIDTGSDVTWIQCKPCKKCYNQTDPIFDPSQSATYKPLTCGNSTCPYSVIYGDKSFTAGIYAKETLMFGSSPVENVTFGCGNDNEGLFQEAAGLLGLARGPFSLSYQTNTSVLSYCLVDKDSTSSSTLEFRSSASFGDDDVTVPLLGNDTDTFYYVGMTGVSVGGKIIPVLQPNSTAGFLDNGVVVDSGTTVTRFSSDVYKALREEFVKSMNGLPPVAPVSVLDTCYDLKSLKGARIPIVAFHFGDKALQLPAKNVMFSVGNGIFCLAFATIDLPVSIIGNIQQQGIRVSFDVGGSLVGFSPDKC